MRALLLAAGLGTRLRPITDTVPKCLVEINGRPLLDHWLELLSKAGIADILVNLHYLPEKVQTYLMGSPHPARVSTVMEADLLGTAGTLLKNRGFFEREPVILIHADNLSLFDVKAFIERFERRAENIDITMMTFHADKPETCGIIELDKAGAVCAFHEKIATPPGNLANAAVYILAPSVIDFIADLDKAVVDFSTEVLPHYMGRINTFQNDTYHRDIGTVDSLKLAQSEYPAAIARQRLINIGPSPA
jgi:mannose-1-phosphate guanylyltransferase